MFLAELPNEGRYVARVIRFRVLGLKPPAPLWYWDKGDLAIVGRTYAVADIRFLRFAGFPAWVGLGSRPHLLSDWLRQPLFCAIAVGSWIRHKAPAGPHPDQPSGAMKNPAENW